MFTKIKLIKHLNILLAMLVLITFSGCWNYREIESLYIVTGMAVDKGENGNKYHLTFQYLIMGGKEKGTKAATVETDGNSIFDCIRNTIKLSQKKMYFSDCKIFIINEELAREGILPLLDFLSRDAEIRITIDLFVSNTVKAGDILKNSLNTSEFSAFSLNRIIENNSNFLAKSPDVALYQANNILFGKGISLTLPLVELKEMKNEKTPQIKGCTVFKEDKLIGFLDDKDVRNMLFVQNKVKGGLILTNLNSDEYNITLEIFNSKTNVKPIITEEKPKFKIEIEVECGLAEENSSEFNVDKLGLEEVQKCAADTIKNEVTETIKKVQQEYKTDIFGFGKNLYQNEPSYWNKFENNWDETFTDIDFEVNAKIKIKNTATANPLKKG